MEDGCGIWKMGELYRVGEMCIFVSVKGGQSVKLLV